VCCSYSSHITHLPAAHPTRRSKPAINGTLTRVTAHEFVSGLQEHDKSLHPDQEINCLFRGHGDVHGRSRLARRFLSEGTRRIRLRPYIRTLTRPLSASVPEGICRPGANRFSELEAPVTHRAYRLVEAMSA
jgi:hypothetical protein